jgi:hypothetical protein
VKPGYRRRLPINLSKIGKPMLVLSVCMIGDTELAIRNPPNRPLLSWRGRSGKNANNGLTQRAKMLAERQA